MRRGNLVASFCAGDTGGELSRPRDRTARSHSRALGARSPSSRCELEKLIDCRACAGDYARDLALLRAQLGYPTQVDGHGRVSTIHKWWQRMCEASSLSEAAAFYPGWKDRTAGIVAEGRADYWRLHCYRSERSVAWVSEQCSTPIYLLGKDACTADQKPRSSLGAGKH